MGSGNGAIPAESREVLRRLKEMILNRPEEEVYVILTQICNMDAVNQLLFQDPFPPELVVDAPVQVSMADNASVDDAHNTYQSEASSVLQRLKEIVNLPEEEISATLKECNTDPNDALDRLLCQDPFQEVKSKREKKKEILQGKDNSRLKSRSAANSSYQGRNSGANWHHGGRGASTSCYTSRLPLHGRSTYKKEKGPGSHTSLVSGVTGCNRSRGHSGLVDDAPVGTGSKGSLSPISRLVSGHQPDLVDVPGQVSMADNGRRDETNKKGSNTPNASHHRIHQSEVSSIPSKDKCSSKEKMPANANEEDPETTLHRLILLRLTPIELVHCKAVCKSWKSLISSSDFVSDHLERSKSDPSSHYLLVRNSLAYFLDEYIPGPFHSVACFSSVHMAIVGSVNGLICIVGGTLSSPKSADDIWILNPATRLSRKLPLPSKSRLCGNNDTILFAFWCDGDVYKVAKVVSMKDGLCTLEVWVSDSPDTWAEVNTFEFHFFYCLRLIHDCDVLIEGLAAYWIVGAKDGIISVLSLDLKTLDLMIIPLAYEQMYLPESGSSVLNSIPNNVLFGGKFKGKFAVMQTSPFEEACFFIWTMVSDNKGIVVGWEMKFKFYLDFLFDRCLGWTVNGKLVFESPRNVLTLYDVDAVTEDILGGDYELEKLYLNSAHDIVASLVSIDGFERNDFVDQRLAFSWPRDYPDGWGRTCKKRM